MKFVYRVYQDIEVEATNDEEALKKLSEITSQKVRELRGVYDDEGNKLENQLQFLLSGQLFDGRLPLQRRRLVGKFLGIDKLQRSSAPGIFGPPAACMGSKALLHIVSHSGI